MLKHQKPQRPMIAFRMSRLRWFLGIIATTLAVANGVIQLDKSINPNSRFRWDDRNLSTAEQVEPKTDVESPPSLEP